ncbi:hypothetical protein OXPF_33750 [Oxobacter pfennigii]|uniref:DUF4491 domain-containing protein n=1 Tax=Oxobacter pfennigii TaxID=36849 RepID=A0A0P8WL62_9CLOT|nr:DUF4491 family protein [Oxobacter pfennigii]KPU43125.1 hypothetical protein OXPF_33750 [Oxobacter pfennigii]
MNLSGVIIGTGCFLIIGLLHPVVIKAEYYFGTKAWPYFLGAGFLCILLSFFIKDTILSALISVLGFSLLWSIKELFEQEKRVKKGWFPHNPKR